MNFEKLRYLNLIIIISMLATLLPMPGYAFSYELPPSLDSHIPIDPKERYGLVDGSAFGDDFDPLREAMGFNSDMMATNQFGELYFGLEEQGVMITSGSQQLTRPKWYLSLINSWRDFWAEPDQANTAPTAIVSKDSQTPFHIASVTPDTAEIPLDTLPSWQSAMADSQYHTFLPLVQLAPSAKVLAQEIIPLTGGDLTVAETGLIVRVPANYALEPLRFVVQEVSSPIVDPLFIPYAFEIHAYGRAIDNDFRELDKNVTIIQQYDPAILGSVTPYDLSFVYREEGEWVHLETVVQEQQTVLQTSLDKLTAVAVVGAAPDCEPGVGEFEMMSNPATPRMINAYYAAGLTECPASYAYMAHSSYAAQAFPDGVIVDNPNDNVALYLPQDVWGVYQAQIGRLGGPLSQAVAPDYFKDPNHNFAGEEAWIFEYGFVSKNGGGPWEAHQNFPQFPTVRLLWEANGDPNDSATTYRLVTNVDVSPSPATDPEEGPAPNGGSAAVRLVIEDADESGTGTEIVSGGVVGGISGLGMTSEYRYTPTQTVKVYFEAARTGSDNLIGYAPCAYYDADEDGRITYRLSPAPGATYEFEHVCEGLGATDTTPPEIKILQLYGTGVQDLAYLGVSLLASITDDSSGVDPSSTSVTISAGSVVQELQPYDSQLLGDVFSAIFESVPENTTVVFTVGASDMAGNQATVSVQGYFVDGQLTGFGYCMNPCSNRGYAGQMVGNPVAPLTGYKSEIFPLLSVPGPGKANIIIAPTYTSGNIRNGIFGAGMNSDLETRLVPLYNPLVEGVEIINWDGARYRFEDNGDGTFTPISQANADKLVKEGDGYLYTTFSQQSYRFDAEGRLVAKIDRNGNEISYGYSGDQLTTIMTGDRTVTLTYVGDYVATISIGDKVITLTYDGDKLVGINDALGGDWVLEYESQEIGEIVDERGEEFAYVAWNHFLTKVMTPEGRVKNEQTYDETGRVIEQSSAAGGSLAFDYQKMDDGSQITTITNAYGHEEIQYYNQLKQLVQRTNRAGDSEYYEYNEDYYYVRKIDFGGNEWLYERDERGNITALAGPEGLVEEWTYNLFNQRTSHLDGEEYLWRWEYDDRGNRVKAIQPGPDGGEMTVTYDNRGLPTDIIDFNGNHIHHDYDPINGDLLATKDGENPDHLMTRYIYDLYGRRVQMVLPRGQNWYYTYNLNDKLTDVRGPLSYHVQFDYDADNLLLSEIDADGYKTTYEYDELARLIEMCNGEQECNTISYGAMNELKTLTDPREVTTTYHYDAKLRVARIDMAEEVTLSYVYDELDNVIISIDGEGTVTATTYDGLSRPYAMVLNYVEGGWQTADMNVVSLFEHNYRNKITKIINPLGDEVEMGYDSRGYLAWRENEEDERTIFKQDGNGNRTLVRFPEGNEIQTIYNGRNQPEMVIDGEGFPFYMRYDANANLIETEAPDGIRQQYAYNALDQRVLEIANVQGGMETGDRNVTTEFAYSLAGDLTSVVDGEEYLFEFVYDRAHRLVEERHPEGWVRYSYDDNGNMVERLDGNDHPWRYEFDDLNRLVKTINPEEHAYIYTFDKAHNVVEMEDPRGNSTWTQYDGLYRPKVVRNALDYETVFTYSSVGSVLAVQDGNGHISEFEYDRVQRLLARIDAEGYRVEYEYDDNGRRTWQRIPFADSAHTIEMGYRYDGRDLVTQYTNGEGEMVAYRYNSVGLLEQEIERDGVVTNYGYDGLRRLNDVTLNYLPGQPAVEDMNVSYQYLYDRVDNLVKVTDPRGYETDFTYNGLGSLLSERNPLDEVWRYQYDAEQNLVERVDAKGVTTVYSYYDDNQLHKIDYAHDTDVVYKYDPNNNTTRMDDGLGQTVWEYDGINRLTAVNDSLGRGIDYEYDAINQIGLTYPDGRTVDYGYLDNNWLETVTDPTDGISTYGYDEAGRIVTVDHPNNTYVERRYDRANRLLFLGNYQDGGDVLSSFTYQYDQVGQREQVSKTYDWRQPETVIEDYGYDDVRRLVAVADSEGMEVTYGYDRSGNRTLWATNDDPYTQTPFDGFTAIYGYNGANQLLTRVADTHPRNPAPRREDNVGQALYAFQHEVAAQRGKHIEAGAADYLLSLSESLLTDLESSPVPSEAEVGAAVAVLLAQVQADGDNGAISGEGIANSLITKLDWGAQANNGNGRALQTTTYSYDANGNRINKEYPGPQGPRVQGMDYTYDDENRLTVAQSYQMNVQGNRIERDITTMAYDGNGRRLVETYDPNGGGGGAKRVEYTFDGLDPIAEYEMWNSPDHHRNYYRGAGGQLIQMHEFPGGTQGSQYWYHHDGLNNVAGLTKHLGQSTHNYRYDAYGGVIPANGNWTQPHNEYTLTEKAEDGHTGLHYFGARYYDAEAAVWLTQDPFRGVLMEPQSLHRYGYVHGNPVNNTDYYGYAIPALVVAGVVGGLIIIDYGWTAYDAGRASMTLADENASPEDKVFAQIDLALCSLELVEPDEALPVQLPIDDLIRKGIGKGAREAYERGGREALEKYLREKIGDDATDKFFKEFGDNIDDVGMAITSNFSEKITKQMDRRGWNTDSIDDVINSPTHTSTATNKANGNSATAYFDTDGSYVVRDDITGDIIQISDKTDPNWVPDNTIENPYVPD
ncbi:MAG TPA: colicin E5-related ribonuclease [Anaerolineae bacterium]|nr:colicin E5-related ribonuclease [Anaerolineae bacterium]